MPPPSGQGAEDECCKACCLIRPRDFKWHEGYRRDTHNEPCCPGNPCCDCCTPRTFTSTLWCCNGLCGWVNRVGNNCEDFGASCKESPGKGWCHFYLSGCTFWMFAWPLVVCPVWWSAEAAVLCADCGEARRKGAQHRASGAAGGAAGVAAAALGAGAEDEAAAQAVPLAEALQQAARQLQRGQVPPDQAREAMRRALAGRPPAALASLGAGADPLALAALRELLPEVCLPPELLRLLLRAAFPPGAAEPAAAAALLNAAASFGPQELRGLVLEEVRALLAGAGEPPAEAAAPAQQSIEAAARPAAARQAPVPVAPSAGSAPAAATLSRLAGCPVTHAALALLELGGGDAAAARELSARPAAAPAPEYYFLHADGVRRWSARKPLPRFQEALRQGLLVKLPVQPELALAGAFRRSCLVVSHRWMKPGEPDTDCSQLRALKEHLDQHKDLHFVWQDWSCMPQGEDKTEEERAYFGRALRDVNLLYLSMRVLILLDASYQTRFWCIYETWCAMRSVRPSGLEPAREGERRWTVACLGSYADSAEHNTAALEKTWHGARTDDALRKMTSDDIQVTNQSDKAEQIKKLKSLSGDMSARWAAMKKAGWIELQR